MTFHAALSRVFRQPARGSGSLHGPMVVPADELRSRFLLSTVTKCSATSRSPSSTRR
jgi:hypothetical protein